VKRTSAEVSKILSAFVEGSGGDYDWDDFISSPIADPALDAIRLRCGGLPEEFPPDKANHYCNDDGVSLIRYYAHQLAAHGL
jgi:hypothetical protein